MTSNENGEQLNNSVQPRQNVTSRSRARRNGGVKRGLSESNSGIYLMIIRPNMQSKRAKKNLKFGLWKISHFNWCQNHAESGENSGH